MTLGDDRPWSPRQESFLSCQNFATVTPFCGNNLNGMLSESQQLWRLDRAASSTEPSDGAEQRKDPSFGLWCEVESNTVESRSEPEAAPDHRNTCVPRNLGRVNLIRPIGRGGMGIVWLGWHEVLRTEVAVKFILNHHLSCEVDLRERERFLIGARAAAAIRHPGLTRVLHADIVNSIPYLVMEFIPGRTIEHVLKCRGEFDQATALSIVDTAAEIVAHLHEHDVVHGDIKPENLLIDRAGELFLTDFGLACRPGPAPCFIAGTPEYMAPEMFDGTISPRSDVYSLGIMLYVLLAGRLPFSGSRDELRICHSSLAIPRAPLLRRGVNEQILRFIERVTNRNSFYRIKSAAQLITVMRSELSMFYSPGRKRERLFALLKRERRGVLPGTMGRVSASAMQARPAGDAEPTSRFGSRDNSAESSHQGANESVARMAQSKREERMRIGAASHPMSASNNPPSWFLTGESLPIVTFQNCCAVCGHCGARKLVGVGTHHCERCGTMMRLMFCGSRRVSGKRQRGSRGVAQVSRQMLSRWIQLLRMPLW